MHSASPSCGAKFKSFIQELGVRVTLKIHKRITHGNHPLSFRLARIFQWLAVPRQPMKLLETLETRVLKRLASAVQLRPWPPHFKRLKSNLRNSSPQAQPMIRATYSIVFRYSISCVQLSSHSNCLQLFLIDEFGSEPMMANCKSSSNRDGTSP
jgi:hypothetical protein